MSSLFKYFYVLRNYAIYPDTHLQKNTSAKRIFSMQICETVAIPWNINLTSNWMKQTHSARHFHRPYIVKGLFKKSILFCYVPKRNVKHAIHYLAYKNVLHVHNMDDVESWHIKLHLFMPHRNKLLFQLSRNQLPSRETTTQNRWLPTNVITVPDEIRSIYVYRSYDISVYTCLYFQSIKNRLKISCCRTSRNAHWHILY